MGSPTLPDDIKATISSPTATICGNFTNTILRLPTLLYEFFNWALTAGGNLSEAFKREVIPSGFLMAAAHATVPTGWLLCNGQEVSREDYADLFTAIGTTYGAGNGTTTFLVPDLRAKFIVGVGTFDGGLDEDGNPIGGGEAAVLGTKGGEDKVALSISEAALNHIHVNGKFYAGSGVSGDNAEIAVTAVDMDKGSLASRRINGAGSGTDATLASADGLYAVTTEALKVDGDPPEPALHNNLPPYLPVNFMIKT